MKTNWQNYRDVILFFGGLAGVFNETVLTSTERPTLLILFAAMMGLPAFLRSDDKNQGPPSPPAVLADTAEEITEKAMQRARARKSLSSPQTPGDKEE
jgi:hypothetical protein